MSVDLWISVPAFGLPAFDPDSLAALALLRLADVRYKTHETRAARGVSETGAFPVVVAGAQVISGFEGISAYVTERGHGLDDYLDAAERADVQATISLVQRLSRVMLFNWWVEDENYPVTRRAIAAAHGWPWPLSYVLTGRMRAEARGSCGRAAYTRPALVYKEADECYKALSTRLGDHRWLFGGRPTSADAYALGHLLAQSRAPMIRDPLSRLIADYPNLARYVEGAGSLLEAGPSTPRSLDPDGYILPALADRRARWRLPPLFAGEESYFSYVRSAFQHGLSLRQKKPAQTPAAAAAKRKEKAFKRRGRVATAAALASMVLYVGVQYWLLTRGRGEEEEDEEFEGDEDE
eukprot:tig00020614_g12200.t1